MKPTIPDGGCSCTRRGFLQAGLSCGAYVALALGAASMAGRRAFAAPAPGLGQTVLTEPYARIEKLSEGIWAIVSTPFPAGDTTTFSNGGIIAGNDATLVVEGFMTPVGAAWAAAQAEALTGRRPTHVVLTHFHPDHSHGLAGYVDGRNPVEIISTEETRRLMIENFGVVDAKADKGTTIARLGRQVLMPDAVIVETDRPTTLDLGGRTVTLSQRQGHTASDLTITLDDPHITFSGDLIFRGLFPYYGDALPTALRQNVGELIAGGGLFVPGHGSVSDVAGLKEYVELLDHVEAAARQAFAAGTPADKAWEAYRVPDSLGEWTKFRPDVYRFGFEAWYRELGDAPNS